MIIFVAGLPGSGKTALLKGLKFHPKAGKSVNVPEVISMEMFDFEEIENKDEETYQLILWDISVGFLKDRIKQTINKELIIYDSCCANNQIIDIIKEIKNHKKMVVFIDTSFENCLKRSVVGKSVLEKYVKKFPGIIPEYKKEADIFYAVNNDGDFNNSSEKFNLIISAFIISHSMP